VKGQPQEEGEGGYKDGEEGVGSAVSNNGCHAHHCVKTLAEARSKNARGKSVVVQISAKEALPIQWKSLRL